MRNFFLAFCFLGVSSAVAKPPASKTVPPAAQKTPQEEEAQRLASEARNAFTVGEYDRAISLLKQAYQQDENPDFLFALGAAYWQSGQLSKAIDAYKSFLSVAPENDDLREEAEKNLITIYDHLEKTSRSAAKNNPLGTPPALMVSLPPEVEAQRKANRRQGWLYIGGGITGLGLVGGAIAFGVVRSQKEEEPAGPEVFIVKETTP